MKRHSGIIVAFALVLTAGCFGSDAGKSSCKAELTYKGKTVNAAGDNEQFAKESACLAFCTEHDENVNEAYQSWKGSPDGQKSKVSRFGEIDNKPELRVLRDGCAKTCNAEVKVGVAKATVKCP